MQFYIVLLRPEGPGSLQPPTLLLTPHARIARPWTERCDESPEPAGAGHPPADVCKQLNMIQQKCICCSFARPSGDFFNTSPHPLFMYSWECGFVTGSDELKQKRHRRKVGMEAEVSQVCCDPGLEQHLQVDLEGARVCKAKRERSQKRTAWIPRLSAKRAFLRSLRRTLPRGHICFRILRPQATPTLLQLTDAGMTPPLNLGRRKRDLDLSLKDVAHLAKPSILF